LFKWFDCVLNGLHALYCVDCRIHPDKQNVLEIVTPLRVFYLQVTLFTALYVITILTLWHP